MSKSLTELSAELVQAQSNAGQMTLEEMNKALLETYQVLKKLQAAEQNDKDDALNPNAPNIAPEKSILRKKIICLECGESFKMLSPKHLRSHGLDQRSYRKKHRLSLRQPLCCKELSERRSKSGKERGLPENMRKAIAARSKKAKAKKKA